MDPRQEMVKVLDSRDMSHFYTDHRPVMALLKPIWDAYVALPLVQEHAFAAAPDDEVQSLVVGFNSGPYHEALLHLETSISVFHMIWNDCPQEIRNEDHCRYAMGSIAARFAPRLKDAEGRLTLVGPDEYAAGPMNVIELLVVSRKARIRAQLREIRQRYQEEFGAESVALPPMCEHTQFAADLINAIFDGITDFQEIERIMRIRMSEEGREILSEPEWKFWETFLFHAHNLAAAFINDVKAIQRELCSCCSGMKGYEYFQALGRPVQRRQRERRERRERRPERQSALGRGLERLSRRR